MSNSLVTQQVKAEELQTVDSPILAKLPSVNKCDDLLVNMVDGPTMTGWDDPNDMANPYNWPSSRKVTIGLVASTTQLITTMSASMVVPALDHILADLGMDAFDGQIAFSVFFLGLGFAPFVVAPLSEMYGRRPVWLGGNLFYILWNSLCPVGKSPALMTIGRFLCACGASVGVTLTSPILADMYTAKNRGTAIAIGSLLPYLGPALGPIIGGVAAQYLHWPWLFWILSITAALGTLLGYLLIPETYGPVLLEHRSSSMTAPVAKKQYLSWKSGWQESKSALSDFWKRFRPAVRAPVRLLLVRPVVQLIALALALEFGTYTLVLGSFATLWQDQYHMSSTQAGLHYIAIAVGALICSQLGSRLMDFIWRRMKAARPNQVPVPEYRIPFIAISIIPSAAGLFWYAWAAQKHAHWAVVDTGIAIFTLAGFMCAQGFFAYLFDEFPQKLSASASAASRLGTYTLGFAFPIFGPDLYKNLGYGWGYTLLGLLFALPTTLITASLWTCGENIREKRRTASEQEDIAS
ncbi:hypothetical protein ANO11243_094310 [Dothideomycetidae sp. 11243]|nr:hypothetical protein ANO11243_094310 [fungal sp. No.11243]